MPLLENSVQEAGSAGLAPDALECKPLKEGSPDWALHIPVSAIDPRDAGTGDDWVPR
jgi:hypothetical protein